MSDAAAPAKAAPKAAPKKKAAAKPKVPAAHPKYSEMIKQAISTLKERGGSSRQAILKYICKNFKVGSDETKVNTHLKMALRAGVKNNSLKNSKGSGASGSFKLGEAAKKVAKPKKATKPKAAKQKKAKNDAFASRVEAGEGTPLEEKKLRLKILTEEIRREEAEKKIEKQREKTRKQSEKRARADAANTAASNAPPKRRRKNKQVAPCP